MFRGVNVAAEYVNAEYTPHCPAGTRWPNAHFFRSVTKTLTICAPRPIGNAPAVAHPGRVR